MLGHGRKTAAIQRHVWVPTRVQRIHACTIHVAVAIANLAHCPEQKTEVEVAMSIALGVG
jgi:hypothetical protein